MGAPRDLITAGAPQRHQWCCALTCDGPLRYVSGREDLLHALPRDAVPASELGAPLAGEHGGNDRGVTRCRRGNSHRPRPPLPPR